MSRIVHLARIATMTVVALVSLMSVCEAQAVDWGVKGGINSSSVNAVPDYYDRVLCCHPQLPNAMVDATSKAGMTAGGFMAWPRTGRVALQGELLFSRRRHSVDLQPYEPAQLTFTRDYVEVGALAKVDVPTGRGNHAYVASGPVFGFRTAERAVSSDPSIRRGDPETDIYALQILPYSAPELLATSQTSLAVAGGWVYQRLLVEVRFTQGLQSIFKDREGLISGFVKAGGDEPTLRRLVPQFGPFLESAKSRDIAVLAGVRF